MSTQAAEQTAEALESIGQHQDSEGAEYRILGPPGCGKTTNTARQVRRAVEKYGENAVLVTSFSRTAAAEIAGRDLPIPASQVGTLHSHCYRALGHPELAEGNVDEWNAANPSMVITQQGKADQIDDGGDEGTGSKDGDYLLAEMGRLRGLMIEPDFWPPNVRHFGNKWDDYKSANGLLDFTDLIDVCLRDTTMAPGAPSVLFADEAQDLTRMMAALVRRWGQWARHFVVVGDDDQCQPAGTRVWTTEGAVSIEYLNPNVHRLRCFEEDKGMVTDNGETGFGFRIAARFVNESLFVVSVGFYGHTRCTENHLWITKRSDNGAIWVLPTRRLNPRVHLIPIPNVGTSVQWVGFTVTERPGWSGWVYSLDVDEHHTYIADGIVTHNCIFSFTGADPDVLINPPIPKKNIIVLKQSYRVPIAVHAEAVKWIKSVRRRQEKEYFPRQHPGKVVRLATGTWDNPGDSILRLLEQHLNDGQSVMFLTACTYQLRPLIKMLRDRGWPFHNPYRRSNGFWNPIRTGKPGTAPNRILSLLAAHPDSGPDQRTWTRQDVASWADWLKSEGVIKRGKKKALHEGDMLQPVSIEDLDQIFTVSALDELLATFEGDRGGLLDWWLRRLDSSAQTRCKFPVTVCKRHGREGLTEEPRIILGTIHSVKGGEADVVVLWPDLSAAGALEYGRAGNSRDSVIRQFYVGMTRAREVLYIGQRATPQAVII